MVLVDREIAELSEPEGGLIDSFDERCLTNIGYDVRAKYFVLGRAEKEKKESVSLNPGESAFVACAESVNMRTNLLCRVVLKNSRIRQGLSLDAPVYQPGHHTRIFFRLTNVSNDELTLNREDKFATLIFEQLSKVPDKPYDGAFSDEFDFSGLGEYQDIYRRQIREIEQKSEDLKSIEHSIYANVLVIITVFVALFSFLTTNLSLVSSSAEAQQFFMYNFLLLGCISFLVALIDGVINRKKKMPSLIVPWIPSVVCFIISIIIFFKF